jgi:hypothetical protein
MEAYLIGFGFVVGANVDKRANGRMDVQLMERSKGGTVR